MNQLSDIAKQIEVIRNKSVNEVCQLQSQAKDLFKSELLKRIDLQALADQVSNSRELTQVDNDEFYHTWIRYDLSQLHDGSEFEKELLTDILRGDYYLEVDFKNDCLSSCIGPAIIISQCGIYDQETGKSILDSEFELCESEDDVKYAIKTYQNESGYFGPVLRVNMYDHAKFFSV